MTHTSLGLLACGLILAVPTGASPRDSHRHAGTHQLAAAHRQSVAHRQSGARRLADDDSEPGDEAMDASVMDDLEACSPFSALDGDKEIDFDVASGEVTETEGASNRLRGDARSPSTKTIGTFVASDQTGRVTMTIRGARRNYTLVIPADGDQCILALGRADAVNLQQSWFGEISDDPQADAPEYQHASAPHRRSGREGRPGDLRFAPPARIAASRGSSPA